MRFFKFASCISCVSLAFAFSSLSEQAFGQTAQGRTSTDPFVVATWNLEWFYDDYKGDNFGDLPKQQSAPSRPDWNWKRDAVAESISKMNADVVAFQEIEGQRALFYLTRAVESVNQTKYRIGFVEGTDYFTEQDVGFLVGPGCDLTRIARYEQSRSMFESNEFRNVSKHAEAIVEVPVGDGVETVTIMTIHLRARAETVDIRTRQARLVHAWLAERIAAGENIIVLGDTNSEETSYPPVEGSDIGALAGLETPSKEDDLIDLGQYMPEAKRATHLLPGKHFDRILVSKSMVEDDPSRMDLVFQSVESRPDLNIRGKGLDTEEQHWDQYWKTDSKERDISDHIPVVAKFIVK